MTRIAVMQPYFAPYAGYFRLAAASDIFVIFDCVQFPRRGWVHRNRLPDGEGVVRWLTLPLAKAPQSTAINAMRFSQDSLSRLESEARSFPDLQDRGHPLVAPLFKAEGSMADWLAEYLETSCALLGFAPRFMRSSELNLPVGLKGQARIIEIVKRLEGSSYINAPGGRDLYDPETFRAAEIELSFLEPYEGDWGSILHRLRHEDPAILAREIINQSKALIA